MVISEDISAQLFQSKQVHFCHVYDQILIIINPFKQQRKFQRFGDAVSTILQADSRRDGVSC